MVDNFRGKRTIPSLKLREDQMDTPRITSMDDLIQLLSDQEKRIHDLEEANAALIAEVKKRFVSKEELPRVVAATQPPYGIVSTNFIKRAFSAWGLHFVAQLIISLVLGLIYFVIFVILLKKSIIPWYLLN
jgi:hypothetical protein